MSGQHLRLDLFEPDETVDVVVDARDRRAGELVMFRVLGFQHGTPQQKMLEASPTTYMTWMVWHAAQRTGQYEGDWATFEARAVGDPTPVKDTEDEGEGEALPDPTNGAPSPDSSAS